MCSKAQGRIATLAVRAKQNLVKNQNQRNQFWEMTESSGAEGSVGAWLRGVGRHHTPQKQGKLREKIKHFLGV